MVAAFAARNYSPGKLLERMWDGEYAGKWLDAATRTAINTGDKALLKKVDQFTTALINHQQPDGYIGIKLPTNRDLNDWEKSWDGISLKKNLSRVNLLTIHNSHQIVVKL